MATAQRVLERLDELSHYFPHGLEYKVAYETTSFVKASIEDVVKTLLEAIALVFLVMYLFLQNFRATLIPTIAVPVVLLGTFAVLYAFGYSINTLTMFAMVLAIGLLVDDAIVVVENVERIMSEEGLSPREATRKSMGQIQGALVGIAMVLSAVFIPMAFFGGTTGAIYRQFSITIVSAMVLSVLVAMILTLPCARRCSNRCIRANTTVKKASSAGLTACLTAMRRAMKRAWVKYCTAACAGWWFMSCCSAAWSSCSCGCQPRSCRWKIAACLLLPYSYRAARPSSRP